MKSLLILILLAASVPTLFAQKAKEAEHKKVHAGEAKATYTCPMHPEVTSYEAGKCPKCGTTLNLSPKEQMKMGEMKMYTCPMHPHETSDKSGKCPKCGMDLKEMDIAYTCPMHSDVTSDKPGKCPKCGTALNLSIKEKMKTEVMKIYTCPMHPEVTSNEAGKCSKCGMDMTVKNQ